MGANAGAMKGEKSKMNNSTGTLFRHCGRGKIHAYGPPSRKVLFLRTHKTLSMLSRTTIFRAAQQQQPIQKKENNTGLPDNLEIGKENLSGYSMDDVKVHHNADQPAQLNAHAYAQGTDIHLAPGQEKHLPHEAWRVVQQKQGRVKPTVQMKGGVAGWGTNLSLKVN